MKIRQVGAELFHADGRTDRHDDVLAFLVVSRTGVNNKLKQQDLHSKSKSNRYVD